MAVESQLTALNEQMKLNLPAEDIQVAAGHLARLVYTTPMNTSTILTLLAGFCRIHREYPVPVVKDGVYQNPVALALIDVSQMNTEGGRYISGTWSDALVIRRPVDNFGWIIRLTTQGIGYIEVQAPSAYPLTLGDSCTRQEYDQLVMMEKKDGI